MNEPFSSETNEAKPAPGPEAPLQEQIAYYTQSNAVAATKPDDNRVGAMIAGLVFILIGGVFALQAMGVGVSLRNWWALFILIPAVSTVGAAVSIWQSTGKFNSGARGSLGASFIIFAIAAMFLLELDWGIWWPLMVVAPGFMVLLTALPDEHWPPTVRWSVGVAFWIGLAMVGLGTTFILEALGILPLGEMLPGVNWWALFILLPGLGAWLHAALVLPHSRAAAISLGAVGTIPMLVGVALLLGLSWDLLLPATLILGGLALLGWPVLRRVFGAREETV